MYQGPWVLATPACFGGAQRLGWPTALSWGVPRDRGWGRVCSPRLAFLLPLHCSPPNDPASTGWSPELLCFYGGHLGGQENRPRCAVSVCMQHIATLGSCPG